MDVVSYILAKRYIDDSLAGAGALSGKSAYDIAVENGFIGTPTEWLASLKGDTPQIGPNGTWVIDGVDTGIVASPSLAGYATEEYVNQQIKNISFPEIDLSAYATREELNTAILGIKIPDVSDFATREELEEAIKSIPAPDLTPYATKEELKQAIDNIPKVDLTGLATEEFVKSEIEKIDIPEIDLSNFYTKDEVDDKIAGIEHPTVDLSNYATKDEIPNIEGLASETYVSETIAAIEIPEAKADINVYEIESDSIVMDELIALLPDGAEIHPGDVMLVTNSLGVKSAYQFDEEWIACDGNVDASKVIMPFDITLAGSYTQVGNLTKTSTGTSTFATKGKSVAQALQEILSKREQPKITANPIVSLTATSGAKEVGSTVAPTWSASLSKGSYTYGPATGITPAAWTINDTNGNTASTASGSFPILTIGDDTKYRISATATYEAGAIAVDNLGDPSNPTVRIIAGSKSATGSYITGYRAWFMYVGTSETAINSTFIRSATNKGSSPSTQNNVSIPAGTKRVMVAIPASSSKKLTSVIDVDGMGLDVFGNFTQSTISVEGLNGYKAASYNVWVAENANGMAATKYNLIIS